MPRCPKCDKEYSEGLTMCDDCREPLASLDQNVPADVRMPKPDPVDFVIRMFTNYWQMWLAGVLFIVMQWSFPLTDWWRSWMKDESYYSHGPLVPLIALFMIWANRKRIARVKVQSSWLGLALVLPSIPIFMFGRWTGSGVICGLTFMTFMIGGVLLFTGTRMTRLLLFPMLYLIFMIPAPAMVLDTVTLPVQMSSTTLAAKMLVATGQDVVQQGTKIVGGPLPDELRVAGECSGFKMLISLLTFSAFFVYMIRCPLWKKLFLFVFSFPLSVFVNGLRIASIGWVGIFTGSSEAMFKFHDTWAMAFELVVSFTILFGVARLIKANDFGIPEPRVDAALTAADDRPPAHKLVGRGMRGPAAIILFALVIATNIAFPPLEASAKGKLVRDNYPRQFGHWTSQDLELDEITANELKTADMMVRVYTDTETGRWVHVLVSAAKDTDAYHDPHSCLPGGGVAITRDQTVTLDIDEPMKVKIDSTMLQAATKGSSQMILYWYMSGIKAEQSTSAVRKEMRMEQVRDRLGYIAHPSRKAEIQQRAENRQWYWYRFVTERWDDEDTDLDYLKNFITEFLANSKDIGG